jgi:hypothetical protein
MISAQAMRLAKLDQARNRQDNTNLVSSIDFPTWVKTSKCTTHSHRFIMHSTHGLRIVDNRTILADHRRRHGWVNCVPVDSTLIR